MTKPIRVALYGLGRMGRNHLRVLRASRRFEVVATVDPVAPDATHVRPPDFDAAIVATSTPTHHDVAGALLRAGKAVLVEKPLASSEAQSDALCALAVRHGAQLAVGHVERFNPALRALGKVLGSGQIGTPIHFSCTRVGGYPPAVTPGNNVTLDLAVHDLDFLRMLLGPLRVVASVMHSTVRPDVCDTAEILLSAQSGASAAVHVNWITPIKIRQVRVTGSTGVAIVDLIAQTCDVAIGTEMRAVPVARVEPLAAELDAFADLIEGRDAYPLCTGHEAARAVALAERALTAADRALAAA